MLTKVPFYHAVTRKLVVSFGGLFGNIFIQTKNKDNKTEKIVKVPLAYANKDKVIVRLQQDPGLQEDVQILLPRMSFEIVGMSYDASRQLNKIHRTTAITNTRNVFMYAPVPYNVEFNLYTYTKTTEDNLQIMEQIIPYFTPDMNLTIKMMADPPLSQDIPLILNSVNTDDEYDGSFEDRRYIITTYSFTMKAYYYGPLLGSLDPEKHFEDGKQVNVIKTVQATVNNNFKYSAVIDPISANVTDPYNITESWTSTPPTVGGQTL
jgi:hypothetical protein